MTHVEMQSILKNAFGFESLRPGQGRIIATILQGRHVLAVMPTGAGKSLCYQVPALVQGGLTLVVSPLVALMNDQVAALRLSGIAAETINSSRPRPDNVASWRGVRAGQVRLLYMAPERLMQPRMLAALQKLPVKLVAVDEAHCISRWGPAFRPDYETLARLREFFPDVPVAAFTATADRATREDIVSQLFDGPAEVFVSGFDRPNIHLAVRERKSAHKQLLKFVNDHRHQSGIVYCLSRNGAERTAAFLQDQGFPAVPYHAGLTSDARYDNQQTFMTRSGTIVVATIAFGMGIDKPDIRFVFHANLPANIEAYYQEIGRAGRDGQPAEAAMLYGLDDIAQRRRFIAQSSEDPEFLRCEQQRLELLIGFCEGVHCRRRALLGAFDEQLAAPCGNCDNCQHPPQLADGRVEGQKVLSAAYRTGQVFGAAHLVDVLTGKATSKARQNGHDQLPTFGVGQDRNKAVWRSIIRQLVAGGFLDIDIGSMGSLKITPQGRRLLAGQGIFLFRAPSTPVPPQRKNPQRARSASAELQPLRQSERILFNHLRELRLQLARERKVPAFAIFHDRTLGEMARHKPKTEADLEAIYGIGRRKMEEFGPVFLAAIAEHDDPELPQLHLPPESAEAETANTCDASSETAPNRTHRADT